MKVKVYIAALLLTATTCVAMESRVDEELSGAEVKLLIKSDFPNIQDQEFDDLYERFGTYQGVWQTLTNQSAMNRLSQGVEKLSFERKEDTCNVEETQEHLQDLAKQYKKLAQLQNDSQVQAEKIRQNVRELNSLIDYLERSQKDSPFSIKIFRMESQIDDVTFEISKKRSKIEDNSKAIQRAKETQRQHFAELEKTQQRIADNEKTISQLQEENSRYSKENDEHHNQILKNIGSLKLQSNGLLELKREHNKQRIKRNSEKILELKKEIISLKGKINNYQRNAQECKATIEDLTRESELLLTQISLEENNLLHLKSSLEFEKKQEVQEKVLKLSKSKQDKEKLQLHYQSLVTKIAILESEKNALAQHHQALKQKLVERERQKAQKEEEQKAHVFNMLEKQFQNLTAFDFNQLYALESGSPEQIRKNIAQKLALKEAQEKERLERIRLEQEKTKREEAERLEHQRQEEIRQQNLADELRSSLLNGSALEKVLPLLKEIKSLRWKWNNDGSTLLHFAVEGGSYDLVSQLLSLQYKGINVNAQLNNGESVLHRAAFLGRADITHLLINQGADVFYQTPQGKLSILDAALHHLEGCIEEERWSDHNNAFHLVDLILRAMKQVDDNHGGYEGGSFPDQANVLRIFNRVCDKIGSSSLEEKRRQEELKRVQQYQEWFLHQLLVHHQQLIDQKRKEEKERKRQEELQRQQSYSRPQYNYY